MIRVLLVEDERIVREGIREILEAQDDIVVVGELDSGAQIQRATLSARPDVVLVDLSMPGVDGAETIRLLRALDAPPPAVVLTTFDTDDNVVRAMQLGAVGFLRKSTSTPALVAGVRAAAAGESVLSRAALSALIHQTPAERDDSVFASLTDREHDLARAVADGASNAEIAAELYLTEATVKSYISRLLTKLDINNRVQLAKLWWESDQPHRDRHSEAGHL